MGLLSFEWSLLWSEMVDHAKNGQINIKFNFFFKLSIKIRIKINLFESLTIKIKLNFDYKKITIRLIND